MNILINLPESAGQIYILFYFICPSCELLQDRQGFFKAAGGSLWYKRSIGSEAAFHLLDPTIHPEDKHL